MAASTLRVGDRYNFVFEPDDALKCLICLEVADDPRQHEKCGRLFCKDCLDRHGLVNPCPNCRVGLPRYFVEARSNRDIQTLQVKCSNVNKECKWVGTVGTLKAHVAMCEFTLVPCPKKCKNKITHFMRKDLDKHLKNDCPNRDYECELCGEKGPYTHMIQVHDLTCDKKAIPCPNAGCPKTMQRRNAKRHTLKCGYSEIPCKYQNLGCAVKMMRKDMPAHEEDDKLHLPMALDKIVSMEEKISTMENRMKEDSYILRNKGAITLKYEDFHDRKEKKIWTFYSSSYGYHMQIRVLVYTDGVKQVSVFVGVQEGKHDAKLKWPFIGKVTIQILNQLEDRNHHEMILPMTKEDNIVIGRSLGYPKFIPHLKLSRNPFTYNTQYLKDDTLYFRVSVDIPDSKPWLECTAKN